ncbi:hypothetical protein QL285_077632 [Trifolium repens]|nr:hypothetical protein QL285_077632 [Trifolium repens]
MVSKVTLFNIQVLLVMVILIPSMGEARNLVEKQNGDAKSDCFWWWPWWPFVPGPPTTPKTPSPPKTPVTPSPSESPKAPSSPETPATPGYPISSPLR